MQRHQRLRHRFALDATEQMGGRGDERRSFPRSWDVDAPLLSGRGGPPASKLRETKSDREESKGREAIVADSGQE